jgi:hypothetical protein
MYEMQNFQQQVDLIPFHNEKCSSVEHSILKIMNKKLICLMKTFLLPAYPWDL